MLKIVNILKEDQKSNDRFDNHLDTLQNRKLLNFISKNINLENFNKSKQKTLILHPFDNKIYNVKHFIRSVLFINEGTKMSELLWLIFLNGDINYLKDELKTFDNFQVYVVNWWSSIEEDWSEEEVDCYECSGDGVQDEDCDMCQGTGEEESDEKDEEGNPIMVECPDCEGEGEVSNDCDYCSGRGYEMEEYDEYVIEEWQSTFLSPNKDIKPPLRKPVKSNTNYIPVPRINELYDTWLDKSSNKSLILFNETIVDERRETSKSYLSDMEGKIMSFSSQSLEDYGFELFLRDFMFGENV